MIAVVAASAIAAVAVPLEGPGLGWLVTVLAATAAMAVGLLVPARPTAATGLDAPGPDAPGPDMPGPDMPGLDMPSPGTAATAASAAPAEPDRRTGSIADRIVWSAATVVLLGIGTFRSAFWLFALCLGTATLTAVLARVGGRTLLGMAAGYGLQIVGMVESLPWLSQGARRAARPIGNGPRTRIARTVALSVVLLIVFGALLASADETFANIVGVLMPELSVSGLFRWGLVAFFALLVIGGSAYHAANPADMSTVESGPNRTAGRWEWAIPLGLLVLLFAMFVGVQLTALFRGERHVQDTAGLTYAEFARGGFWQLSAVTALVLVVLGVAARLAPRDDRLDRILIRVVFGALAGLTLVIVASALLRMNLYAQAYGLTRLRLLVALCECWFGLVLIMVLASGVRTRAPWLPRAAVGAAVVALIGLAVANPDARIAAYNIGQNRTVDVDYLGDLSPDAVPELMRLNERDRDCVLLRIRREMTTNPDDWSHWNLGRERARDLISAVNPVESTNCY